MQAKPSGKPWTNPAIKAWINVNVPKAGSGTPKNERQAYLAMLRSIDTNVVPAKF